MDLSKVKWVIIAVVVTGGFWLVTEGGVSYMIDRFSSTEPGQDLAVDERNEAGLTRIGTFLMMTFRYRKADEVFEKAIEMYPEGKNAYYNYFRQARCAEKEANYKRAVVILEDLIEIDWHNNDRRIPTADELSLRANKLIELHDLGEMRPRSEQRRLL